MSYNFHVGQRVVCIDDRPVFGHKSPLSLKRIYTITGKSEEAGWFGENSGWFPVVSVVGVKSFHKNGRPHPWFAASRFRPLVTRPSDISIFTALLNPHRQSEDA